MPKSKIPPPEIRPSTAPKFKLVKNTFEILTNRVATISADTGYADNPNRMKYYWKMVKMRRRVENLLQTYPQFEPEPKTHDPTEATIPEELQEALKKLAMPSRKHVVATFVKINSMVREIKDDHYYYKNPLKAQRIRELCRYRKQICCLYSKYHPEPDLTYSCYQFKPCSTKFAPIYAIARSSKNKKRIIKIKSRVLYFDYDDETVELALPIYRRITDTFDFYNNLTKCLKLQICEHSESMAKKKILGKLYCAAGKRRDFLEGLKAEIECRKKIEVKPEEKNVKFAVEGTFDKKFTNFTPYTHFLELPSRKKLKDVLEVQTELLAKVKKEVEGCATCTVNSEKFLAKVENHVKFVESILEKYPIEEKPPHCSKPDKEAVEPAKKVVSVKTIKGENGKETKQYTFDPKTNELAFPKIGILTAAKEVHERILNEFNADTKNIAAMNSPDTPAPEPEAESEEVGPKKLPSEGQKKQQNAAKVAGIIKKDHAGLVGRTDRLAALIKGQTERIEHMESAPSPGGVSYFLHHRSCATEQEVDEFEEYEMQNPHKPITNSVAKRNRMLASLEVYQKLFESRQGDIVFKRQYELVLNTLDPPSDVEEEIVEETPIEEPVKPVKSDAKAKKKTEIVTEIDKETNTETDEVTPDTDVCGEPSVPEEQGEKVDKHLLRLVQNMRLLEKNLEENPPVESCIHKMSHSKHESPEAVPIEQRPPDVQRMNDLAQPTKVRLRNTLEGFRQVMSREKQDRLECQLGKEAMSPEQLEESARAVPQVKAKNEPQNAALLLTMIERKVTADIFDEIASELKRTLPKLIKNYKEPMMVTSYWLNLRNIALALILSSHGPWTSQEELEVINNLAGIISDFIIKIQIRSLESQCVSSVEYSKPLHSIQQNEFLLGLANKLIKKL